jgi:hypothetical protein
MTTDECVSSRRSASVAGAGRGGSWPKGATISVSETTTPPPTGHLGWRAVDLREWVRQATC